IFLVPLRLEDCETPTRLRDWQWVDLFEPQGYQRLLGALRERSARLAGLYLSGESQQATIVLPAVRADSQSPKSPSRHGSSRNKSFLVTICAVGITLLLAMIGTVTWINSSASFDAVADFSL